MRTVYDVFLLRFFFHKVPTSLPPLTHSLSFPLSRALSSRQFSAAASPKRFHTEYSGRARSLFLPPGAFSRSARNHSRRNFTAAKATAVTSSAINRPDTTDTSHSRSFCRAFSRHLDTFSYFIPIPFLAGRSGGHQRADSTISPVPSRIRRVVVVSPYSRKIKRVSPVDIHRHDVEYDRNFVLIDIKMEIGDL